jgi:hypothetical protein
MRALKFVLSIIAAVFLISGSAHAGDSVLTTNTGAVSVLSGVPMIVAGLNKEAWVPGIEDAFRFFGSWYDQLRNFSQYAGNESVNLQKVGADPVVLFNPSYPLTAASRTDLPTSVGMTRVVTTPTQITDMEIQNLAYDKNSSVRTQHSDVLKRGLEVKALHNIAPQEEVAGKTIVMVATGDPHTGTRKSLTYKDVRTLAYKMNKLKWPKESRVLVLSAEHQLDLQLEDQKLYNQIFDVRANTLVPRFAGFEMYEEIDGVMYNATNQKKAFDAAPAGTDRIGSVAFLKQSAWRADDQVKAYSDESLNNPLTHTALFDLGTFHGSGALYDSGVAAIVSPAS